MVVSLLARPLASRGRRRAYLQFRARVRIKRAVQAALAPQAAPRLPPWVATLFRERSMQPGTYRCLGRYMASAWAGRPDMHVPPPFGDVAWGYQGWRAEGVNAPVRQPRTADTRRAEPVVGRCSSAFGQVR